MTPVARVLRALEGHDVRRCGKGWIARCPGHEDRHASLTISEGREGRALLHCHGGCEVAAVLRAVGLTMRDLYAGPPARTDGRTGYDYFDERGELLYQVVRVPTPDGGKRFWQRRLDGEGGWIGDTRGVRRVLYRLPELLAAPATETVYIVEGEKDVEALRAAGKVATCNPGGAGKWRAEFSEALRGRRVVVLPDADEPGRQHAADVARSLDGVAASVGVLELPGLPPKGDVSDWLAAGHSADELADLCGVLP